MVKARQIAKRKSTENDGWTFGGRHKVCNSPCLIKITTYAALVSLTNTSHTPSQGMTWEDASSSRAALGAPGPSSTSPRSTLHGSTEELVSPSAPPLLGSLRPLLLVYLSLTVDFIFDTIYPYGLPFRLLGRTPFIPYVQGWAGFMHDGAVSSDIGFDGLLLGSGWCSRGLVGLVPRG